MGRPWVPRDVREPGGYGVHVNAAQRIRWDLTVGNLSLWFDGGGPGFSTPLRSRMSASLQAFLREAGLPDHFTMHSFRVGGPLTRFRAGTAVDEIKIKIK